MAKPRRQARTRTQPAAPQSIGAAADRQTVWMLLGLVVLVTLAVYGRVAGFGFINNYDDAVYVTGNPYVTSGLTAASVKWAFTNPCAGNWHPLTMLSHMLDCQLFGLSPGKHHLVNLLLHVLNAVLLFWVLAISTKNALPSLLVAALFALHPMHVESVAWIAERKDVLSTLFWLLTMWAYVRYVRHGGGANYALIMAFFALGLMAKSMLVTLPFVLVLLDFWPLGRIAPGRSAASPKAGRSISLTKSLFEKTPLIFLAIVSSALTIHAQQQIGATRNIPSLPLTLRIGNALVAYVTYVVKLFVPHDLAAFYPYPVTIPLHTSAGAALVLAAITVLLFTFRVRAPYALTGWLWYLGTLVPVIGVLQVGSQAMADRYSYVPHIGLCLAIVWGCRDAVKRWRVPRRLVAVACAGALALLSVVTWHQTGYWKGASELFGHAIDVTQGNFVAHNNYGLAMLEADKVDEAIEHFQSAVRINPTYAPAVYNLGYAYQRKGTYDRAVEMLTRAVSLAPDNWRPEYNLGVTLALQTKYTEAFPHYQAALRRAPNIREVRLSYSNALNNHGLVLGRSERYGEAAGYFEQALEVDPNNEGARHNLAFTNGVLTAQGAGRR